MNIKEIKSLRDYSGCGISDCKNALVYAEGNWDIAVAYLKAKYYAVNTGNVSFDERVKMFLNTNKDKTIP